MQPCRCNYYLHVTAAFSCCYNVHRCSTGKLQPAAAVTTCTELQHVHRVAACSCSYYVQIMCNLLLSDDLRRVAAVTMCIELQPAACSHTVHRVVAYAQSCSLSCSYHVHRVTAYSPWHDLCAPCTLIPAHPGACAAQKKQPRQCSHNALFEG